MVSSVSIKQTQLIYTWFHSSALVTAIASYNLATEAIWKRCPFPRKPSRQQRKIAIISLIKRKPPIKPNITRSRAITRRAINSTDTLRVIRVVEAIVLARTKIEQLPEHIMREVISICLTVKESFTGAQVFSNIRHVETGDREREIIEKNAARFVKIRAELEIMDNKRLLMVGDVPYRIEESIAVQLDHWHKIHAADHMKSSAIRICSRDERVLDLERVISTRKIVSGT